MGSIRLVVYSPSGLVAFAIHHVVRIDEITPSGINYIDMTGEASTFTLLPGECLEVRF